MKGDAQWSSQIMEENSRLNGQLTHYKKKCSDQQAEIDEAVWIINYLNDGGDPIADDCSRVIDFLNKHKGE